MCMLVGYVCTRICLRAYVPFFMYLLWVVTNQGIFTEIGHELIF